MKHTYPHINLARPAANVTWHLKKMNGWMDSYLYSPVNLTCKSRDPVDKMHVNIFKNDRSWGSNPVSVTDTWYWIQFSSKLLHTTELTYIMDVCSPFSSPLPYTSITAPPATYLSNCRLVDNGALEVSSPVVISSCRRRTEDGNQYMSKKGGVIIPPKEVRFD